jgi:hypothetical protein
MVPAHQIENRFLHDHYNAGTVAAHPVRGAEYGSDIIQTTENVLEL